MLHLFFVDMNSNVYPSTVHDWMNAIRRPVPYRVGNARLHIKTRTVAYTALFISAILILVLFFLPKQYIERNCFSKSTSYDSTYPFTEPFKTEYGTTYRIAVVTDLDTDSKSKKDKNTWFSYLLYGNLTLYTNQKTVDVTFSTSPTLLKSTLSQGGRGMELSELVVFNGKLYTVDDRTGVIYEVSQGKVFPWVLLTDGDGRTSKGFKCEWAAVKNERLYVGGLGKEWTTGEGKVVNLNPQWVKSISPNGVVIHHDWHENYNAMRKETKTNLPGYMIHESAVWSDIHKRWFFLPRRASQEHYDEIQDEKRATNLMIIANEKFDNIEIRYIGIKHNLRGFSSFKFIPGTNDQIIVALKSEEYNGKICSYILVFTIDGEIILNDKKIGDYKYEGFKCEWAAVKNERLYVGGLGKEWTTGEGKVVNLNPQWVKSISPNGVVIHHNWHENYNAMRKETKTNLPGYMIHESAVWSDIHKRWFFLPRRASQEHYDEIQDEKRATNLMIIANEKFDNIEIRYIGIKHNLRGFSSFKFIPGTNDQIIVALKSEEYNGKICSYILVFTIDGEIILNDKKIGDYKYEGIEFV